MQGENSASINNAINIYLESSQIPQVDSEHTSGQRHHHKSSTKDPFLSPDYLPSYEDVLSGRFENIEPPPLYAKVMENNLGAPSKQSWCECKVCKNIEINSVDLMIYDGK